MFKVTITGAIAMILVSSSANALNQNGYVNFKGAVIDAPCGIAPEKEGAAAEVDFGQVAKSHLAKGGVRVKDFYINLTNCDVTGLKKGVAMVFSGNTVKDTTTELATSGPTGTSIVLNSMGKDIPLGVATDYIMLSTNDNNTLKFSSVLKQATGKSVSGGDFSAVAYFNLNYQ